MKREIDIKMLLNPSLHKSNYYDIVCLQVLQHNIKAVMFGVVYHLYYIYRPIIIIIGCGAAMIL